MSPHFLCCLPIRLGAFLVSFVELVLSGIVAALMWLALVLDWKHKLTPELTTNQQVVIGLWATSYTVASIFSWIGIVGVLRKRISWVQTFLSLLQWHLAVSVIITIINMVFFFINEKDKSCLITNKDGNCADDSLSKAAQIAILIVVAIIPLLIQAYGCWILSDCVTYLKDKQVYPMTMYPFSSGYAGVGSKEEAASLTHNSGSATGAPYAMGGV
ncbi:hypothetical protein BDP27DRAFT_1309869 [Rhodocollybia butyracea]|uniref:Uncharacterized protein n=1 Tax=Rhodocollybia butyracea TaxID=206335 RepID=A0A9P5QCV9_9AGAR|nr:hypothetical protein BDP27DRAFT_1309869 [Rhodocollybia butyracea]